MNDQLRDSLRTVLNPKSIAVIGASENQNKIGGARGHVSAAGARLRVARRVRRTTKNFIQYSL
jgi:hypothetical protein